MTTQQSSSSGQDPKGTVSVAKHRLANRPNARRCHRAIGLLAAGIAVVAVACDDHSTAPNIDPARSVAAHPVPGNTSQKSIGESPDNVPATLHFTDTAFGDATTPRPLGFFPHWTVFQATITGIMYKKAAVPLKFYYDTYGPSGYGFGPAGARIEYWRNQWGADHFTFPGLASASASSMYVLVKDSVYVAWRTGIGNSEQYDNVDAVGGGKVSCGLVYGYRCFYYAGDPGTLTMRRLDAGLSLSADSTTVNSGSKVTFRLRAVPDSVEGQQIPVDVDTAARVPDPDSLGGDYSEAQKNGACNFSGYPSAGGDRVFRVISVVALEWIPPEIRCAEFAPSQFQRRHSHVTNDRPC